MSTCHTIGVISVELLNKVELLSDAAINVVLNIAGSTPQRDRNVLNVEKAFSIKIVYHRYSRKDTELGRVLELNSKI